MKGKFIYDNPTYEKRKHQNHVFKKDEIVRVSDWPYIEDSFGRKVAPYSFKSFVSEKFVVVGIGLFESLNIREIFTLSKYGYSAREYEKGQPSYPRYMTVKMQSLEDSKIYFTNGFRLFHAR